MTDNERLARIQFFVAPGAFDQAVAALEAATGTAFSWDVVDERVDSSARMAIATVGGVRIHTAEGPVPSNVLLEITCEDVDAAVGRVRAAGVEVKYGRGGRFASISVESMNISLLPPLGR